MDFDYEWTEAKDVVPSIPKNFIRVRMELTKNNGERTEMVKFISEDSAWSGAWLEMFSRFCAAEGFIGVGDKLEVADTPLHTGTSDE